MQKSYTIPVNCPNPYSNPIVTSVPKTYTIQVNCPNPYSNPIVTSVPKSYTIQDTALTLTLTL